MRKLKLTNVVFLYGTCKHFYTQDSVGHLFFPVAIRYREKKRMTHIFFNVKITRVYLRISIGVFNKKKKNLKQQITIDFTFSSYNEVNSFLLGMCDRSID